MDFHNAMVCACPACITFYARLSTLHSLHVFFLLAYRSVTPDSWRGRDERTAKRESRCFYPIHRIQTSSRPAALTGSSNFSSISSAPKAITGVLGNIHISGLT